MIQHQERPGHEKNANQKQHHRGSAQERSLKRFVHDYSLYHHIRLFRYEPRSNLKPSLESLIRNTIQEPIPIALPSQTSQMDSINPRQSIIFSFFSTRKRCHKKPCTSMIFFLWRQKRKFSFGGGISQVKTKGRLDSGPGQQRLCRVRQRLCWMLLMTELRKYQPTLEDTPNKRKFAFLSFKKEEHHHGHGHIHHGC